METCMVKPNKALQPTETVASYKPSTRSTQILRLRQVRS